MPGVSNYSETHVFVKHYDLIKQLAYAEFDLPKNTCRCVSKLQIMLILSDCFLQTP